MMYPHDAWGAFVERAADDEYAKPGTGPNVGPLVGVRLAVKDNIAVAGLPWTAGLPLLATRRATTDAPCVAMLRAAGVRVVGVTATDAAGFGMTTPGVTNPRDASLTAGGSSGGSAAAVAAGLADLALGTDTAGSVRVPAACCGLVGYKPSHGAISVDGVTPLSASFDHVGLIAADLGLIERAASVLLRRPRQAPSARPFAIGFDPSRLDGLDAAIAAAMQATLARLDALGARLVEVRLPERRMLAEIHGLITCAEAREAWSAHWPQHQLLFGDTARRSLAYVQTIPEQEIADARQAAQEQKRLIEAAFDEVDVIVGPTLRVAPPPAGARRVIAAGVETPVVLALMSETCVYNLSGHAAVALPLPGSGSADGLFAAGQAATRIPISLQIAGRDDMELLAIAQALAATLAENAGAENAGNPQSRHHPALPPTADAKFSARPTSPPH